MCAKKKIKSFRLVSDLRHLNSFCPPPKFKFEYINTVTTLIKPKNYLITADFQNGFHHVKVHPDHSTLLGFSLRQYIFSGQFYPMDIAVVLFLFC